MCTTLDLILKTLITSSDFASSKNKNWDVIAKLVSGTSATQCARRYEELVASGGDVALQHLTYSLSSAAVPKSASVMSLAESELSGQSFSSSRPNSSKNKGNRDDQDKSDGNKGRQTLDYEQNGPVMVIHVCDEAKNLKKDFNCSRDLLVQEMKYFADYLSTDAQRWEEVDISVHCNVQIFDWLMKYVKRGTKEVPGEPKLEPNNVISILISSDFLKMDSLVTDCITFCHDNMDAIVASPCNMSCINDRLLIRMAELFHHNEVDNVKDRKDKFRSKLFCKKIEALFQPDSICQDSPGKATTLFRFVNFLLTVCINFKTHLICSTLNVLEKDIFGRCNHCKRYLTQSLQVKVKCLPNRMTFNRNGLVTYCHSPDPTFDLNDFVVELKNQLKTWRDVYWRLWGMVNFLTCDRCKECFPLTDFAHCSYHPEQPYYENEPGCISSYIGTLPCCNQKAFRFDPLLLNQGCQVKDHQVKLPVYGDGDKFISSQEQQMYSDLLLRRDVVCLPFQSLYDVSSLQTDVFANEVFACHSHTSDLHIPSLSSTSDEGKQTIKPRLQPLVVEKEISYTIDDVGAESDDEVGDEESQSTSGVSGKKPSRALKKSRITVEPQAILVDAPGFEQTQKSTWDSQRSMRYNQDAQRQEDARRMKEIRLFLTKLRLTAEKVEKPRKEYAGGIYSKLDSQWKANNPQFQGKPLQQLQIRSRLKPTSQGRPSFA